MIYDISKQNDSIITLIYSNITRGKYLNLFKSYHSYIIFSKLSSK